MFSNRQYKSNSDFSLTIILNLTMKKDIGIVGMEIYFPRSFVEQSELEEHCKVSKGKYTVGLGQDRLSFAYEFQDVNSMSLTVVDRLLRNYGVDPNKVGRLEIGTETLLDKSKSTKTVLMTLFKDNHDIEGATSVNACYGATNALFNALNWVRSDTWDGRLAIVVACDIAVYEKGPARPTGGAGAVAMLIGPNARIVIDPIRSTFIDHQYDFYKPIPASEYPIVDGTLSINCYLSALEQCYRTMQKKHKAALNKQFSTQSYDFLCFHCPFYKMVQKAFSKLIELQTPTTSPPQPQPPPQQTPSLFTTKVHPGLLLSKTLGNIYTGSLYTSLFSLLLQPNLKNKSALMFSYGSGLMSSMFTVRFKDDLQDMRKLIDFQGRLNRRVKVSPMEFEEVLAEKERRYGKLVGKIAQRFEMLEDGTYYLQEVDEKFRRKYGQVKYKENSTIGKKDINSTTAMQRIESLDHQIVRDDDYFSGFYKLPVQKRIEKLLHRIPDLDVETLESGGLSLPKADVMIENVVGRVGLPLAVAPNFLINKKPYIIPMCIQQPSVVAACSSVAKMLSPYGFTTSSTPALMIGQIHLPSCQTPEVHLLLTRKRHLLSTLNTHIPSLIQRGGGVQDLRVRKISQTSHVLEIIVNVCEAMGANIVNTLCEKLKTMVTEFGIRCGVAVLSNYSTERMAMSMFEVPVREMEWKGYDGGEVVERILEAYEFAKIDRYRAATHNKGILNGIDGVCLATGQDWRAVESAAHVHASITGKYLPLTKYEIVDKKGVQYFRGSIELPISVGTVGGALEKNPIYKVALQILGNPDSKDFSEILVTVGLAQNFAALRALAIEGIQKGHMVLHARSVAVKAGVPPHLVDEACRFMSKNSKFDEATAKRFLSQYTKPRL